MLTKKTIKMLGGVARNPATGDVTGYATLASLLRNDFGLDPNLRDPVIGEIQKSLMKTLAEDPRHFSQHNGGLMFVARTAAFDSDSNALTLTMQERTPSQRGAHFDDGQADGANSLNAARELVRQLSERAKLPEGEAALRLLDDVLEHAVFRIEAVVDLPAERLPKVCAHRNSNRKQKAISVVNHEDGFARLKSALGSSFGSQVSFFEGDRAPDGSKKRVEVSELVRLLVAAAGDSASPKPYSNVGLCPSIYQEKMEAEDPRYLAATRNIGMLITLRNALDEAASLYAARHSDRERYRWSVTRPKGGFKLMFDLPPAGRSKLEYEVPGCFIMPIFGAVARNLMRDDGSWVEDPTSYVRSHKAALFDYIFAKYKKSGKGSTNFGNDASEWGDAADLVHDTVRA